MKVYRVAIIGLGIMGRSMLASMAEHDRCRGVCGWDPTAESLASAKVQFPAINILLGPVAGINIDLHVSQWPRAFQVSAGWLKGRKQGGDCREVFSHWIY